MEGDLQRRENLVRVAFRLDLVKDLFDLAVRSDDESGACHSHHFLAIHILFLHDAVGLGDRAISVGQKDERQVEFGLELGLCLDGIRRDV